MPAAEVRFERIQGVIKMHLRVSGKLALVSSSVESIVSVLQARRVRRLTIDDLFSTALPTVKGTLDLAAQVAFEEELSALRLIAACAAMEDTASLFPAAGGRRKPAPTFTPA